MWGRGGLSMHFQIILISLMLLSKDVILHIHVFVYIYRYIDRVIEVNEYYLLH